MHSAVPRAFCQTEQADFNGYFKAGISTAADVNTFYCVCSFSITLSSPASPILHVCASLVYIEKVSTCANVLAHPFHLRYPCMCITVHVQYSSGHRVDRPSEPLWQMKVMLRGRGARSKAGNKQPDLWRTLKHTSERKEERGKQQVMKGQNGVGWFSSPYRAETITDQTAGHLSNAE